MTDVCVCVLSRFNLVQLFVIIYCSPPGFSVHGILQARMLEWVVMPSSRGSSPPTIAGGFFRAEPLGKSMLLVGVVNQELTLASRAKQLEM